VTAVSDDDAENGGRDPHTTVVVAPAVQG